MKKHTLPLVCAAIITIIFATIYVAEQQVLRQSANDPQIQMAEDTAAALNNSATPTSVITPKIDVGKSLSPFIIVYDKTGAVAASSVYSGSKLLDPVPLGVLKASGVSHHAVTWEPETNIRIAAVTTEADGFYVLAGRSLKEIESRESSLMWLVLIGWAVSIAVMTAAYWLYNHPINLDIKWR